MQICNPHLAEALALGRHADYKSAGKNTSDCKSEGAGAACLLISRAADMSGLLIRGEDTFGFEGVEYMRIKILISKLIKVR
jgi:hypothetical protein